MTKRNTDGYVMAYLLIVVAIMGFLAATLMASTLQVVQAQEKSIQYMQDKYAAMGEVERLVAELDAIQYEYTPAAGNEKFYTTDPEICIVDAKNYLSTVLLPALSSQFSSMTINYSIEDDPIPCSLSASMNSSAGTLMIDAMLSFRSGIQLDETTKTRTEDILDPETSDVIGTREISEQWYSYSIDITNIQFSSYSVTSLGGAA